MVNLWNRVLGAGFMLAVTLAQQLYAAGPTPRIVGGTVVPDARYAFMAAIYLDTNGDNVLRAACGGSLVSDRWVLTAAHCVVNAQTGQQLERDAVATRVDVQDIFDQSQGTFISTRQIIVHPNYDRQTLVSDLALIELTRPVDLPVIALPVNGSDVPLTSESAIVTGWGVTSDGGQQSGPLREVNLPVVSHIQCLPYYHESLQAQANLCAGGLVEGGRDSCQGDSGGPLFVIRNNVHVQAGIVSYGDGCAQPYVPAVYTRMTSYTEWVQSFIPDVVTVSSGQGNGQTDQPLNDSLVLLSASRPSLSGDLAKGDVAVYEVTGAMRVELKSNVGDADLILVKGAESDFDSVVCVSELTTPFDECDVPGTEERHLAIVFGYSAASFDIRVVGVSAGGGVASLQGVLLVLLLVLIRRRSARRAIQGRLCKSICVH